MTTQGIGKVDWGTFLGAGALLLLAAAFLVGFVLAHRWHRNTDRIGSDGDWGLSLAAAIAGAILAATFAAMALWVLWPFDWDYLSWHEVDGKVDQVSSRLVPQNRGMAQRFVLVMDGRPFAVDDTRASLVKAGDRVTLACKKEYQYAAESGWACNWGAP